jgi:hypothetical protein
MEPTTAALLGTGVAAFGIVAAFGGVLMGQRMARNTQREQWLRDSRKQEFKELLTVLTKSFAVICDAYSALVQDSATQVAVRDAEMLAVITIRDRVYIAEDIKRLNIYKIWRDAVNEFIEDHVFIAFSEQYALINAMVVDAANSDKKKKL